MCESTTHEKASAYIIAPRGKETQENSECKQLCQFYHVHEHIYGV